MTGLPPQELAAAQYDMAASMETSGRIRAISACLLAIATALIAINDTLRERLPRP